MTSLNPLRSIYLRLDRASQHLDSLKSEIFAYTKDRPYVPIIKDEATLQNALAAWPGMAESKRGDWLQSVLQVIVSEVRPIPEIVPLILGDFLHNLRSSLDHLAGILVRATGQTPIDGRSGTAFPILSKKPPTDAQTGLPASPLLSPRTTNAIERELDLLQPYNAGDTRGEKLALIRDLNNRDKHRTLHVVAAHIGCSRIVATYPNGHIRGTAYRIGIAREGAWQVQRLEPQATLGGLLLADAIPALLQTPGEMKMDVELNIIVSLDEAGTFDDPPTSVLDTMQDLLDVVKHDVVPLFAQFL